MIPFPPEEISASMKCLIQFLTDIVLFCTMFFHRSWLHFWCIVSFILGDQSFSGRRQLWQLFPRFSYTWGWRFSAVCARRRKRSMVSTAERQNLTGRTAITSWKKKTENVQRNVKASSKSIQIHSPHWSQCERGNGRHERTSNFG